MTRSEISVSLILGIVGSTAYAGAAAAAEQRYGQSNHFAVQDNVCNIVKPFNGGVPDSREEAQKIERELRLCTNIAQKSRSAEPSSFYDRVEKALGVCEYPDDARKLSNYQTNEKLIALKDAVDWTADDVATVGVYVLDCGANVSRNPQTDFPIQTTSILHAMDIVENGIARVVLEQRAGREQMKQMQADSEARQQRRAEVDAALRAEGYTRMSLANIKLDAQQHIGEKVVTSGYMYIVRNDTGLIMVNKNDTNFVVVDIANASRDFRQQALRRCSSNFRLCQIEIKGTLDRKDEVIIIRAD